MIPMPVVKKGDRMLGLDFHDCIVAPVPIPMLCYLHGVGAMVGWVADRDQLSPNVLINGKPAATQFHDIKYLIPHIPLPPVWNVLLLIIIPLSSSKVMLGASTVLVNGKPIAVGPLPVLNCGDPMSTPTGVIIPITNVFAGVSLADFFMAIAVTLVEMAISRIVSKVADFIGKRIASAVSQRVASRVTTTLTSRIASSEMRTVIQRIGVDLSGNVMVAVEREIGQSLSQKMTQQSLKRAGFLFTEQVTSESFEASQRLVVRETLTAASEHGIYVSEREVISELSESFVRETYTRGASKASEEMVEALVGAALGNTAGDALVDAVEGFAQDVFGPGR